MKGVEDNAKTQKRKEKTAPTSSFLASVTKYCRLSIVVRSKPLLPDTSKTICVSPKM